MNDRILVAYASQTGSTAEVAEAIGKTLMENGLQVDVLPMKAVQSLAAYRAVVAGSAIHGGKWLPEAMRFLRRYQVDLNQKPFAAFLVCITLGMKNGDTYRQGVANWMGPVRMLVKPFSEGLFAGSIEIKKIPISLNGLLLRIAVFFGLLPKGDHRDWNAIRAWAVSLAAILTQ